MKNLNKTFNEEFLNFLFKINSNFTFDRHTETNPNIP